MQRPIIVLTFCLISAQILPAQSPTFSQFYALKNAMNPAYVSTVQGLETAAGYRIQWGQLQEGFRTAFASVVVRSCQAPFAFGAYASNVQESFFGYKVQEGGMQVSAFVGQSDRWSLHGGLQAGIGQHRVDYDRLVFSGQLDPVFGIQPGTSTYFQNDGSSIQTFEIGGGLVARGLIGWRNGELPASLGVAVQHLSGSRENSFLRLDNSRARRYTLHGSITTPVTGGMLHKDVLYLNWVGRMEWESTLSRGTAGVIFQYTAAHVALLYQWNQSPFLPKNTHAMTLAIGTDFKWDKSTCSIQYAFDGTLSGLGQTATGGAHEVNFIFTLPKTCIFKGRNTRGRTECYYFNGKSYQRFLN